MATVTILDHTFTLPAIATKQFRGLQEQIHERQRRIQEGTRAQRRWLGLLGNPAVQLSESERFAELAQLVRDYDTIMHGLRHSQEAYEAFFTQLASGVRQAVWLKSAAMRELEQQRRSDYQVAVAQHDDALARLAQEDEATLLRGVRLLTQATLLLLKKVTLCQEGLSKLATDQELQRRVLTQLTDKLHNYLRAYERRQRIERVVREVAEMAQVALHFEAYVREHLGPLQGLMEQVVHADESLHRAVSEIEAITRHMLQQGTTSFTADNDLDERLLTFLTTSYIKRERLEDVLTSLERQGNVGAEIDLTLSLPTASSLSVFEALDNIESLVELRLTPLLPANPPATTVGKISFLTWPRLRRRTTTPAAVDTRYSNSLGMTFVRLPAGKFFMGTQDGREHERPQHWVHLGQAFYLATCAVTQAQWLHVMGDNPSRFRGLQHPVENVSWADVQVFIERLNAHEDDRLYRLPTEAEWEYAARAGSAEAYSFGTDSNQLSDYAWYAANARRKTQAVAQQRPNAWGLYDLHGNVWEWVHDWFGPYPQLPATDPQGPASGSTRVCRGGSWSAEAVSCRSAYRHHAPPESRRSTLGFRLLRIIP